METIPEDKYRFAFSRGRPRHGSFDDFSLRHPKMQPSQRAKIFSPFSALTGFEEAIDEKLQVYVEKRELSDEEQEALEAALSKLHALTRNSRAAKAGHVCATVVYYVPCADENHEAYGCRGTYERYTGTVWKVDPVLNRSLVIGGREIEFTDLAEIIIQDES